jgi:hypothetical protein
MFSFAQICAYSFHTPSVTYTHDTISPNISYLQYTVMLCCFVLSFVHKKCRPLHVHICPLLSFDVTSSTLEMASSVDGLPVEVIWLAPSHDHVIVATGFPPCMVHVRVTLLPSIIGPTGFCFIVGDVVGSSKTDCYSFFNNFK